MGWGGDMFPGNVSINTLNIIYRLTQTHTQTNPLERQTTGQSLCIKKDKKT